VVVLIGMPNIMWNQIKSSSTRKPNPPCVRKAIQASGHKHVALHIFQSSTGLVLSQPRSKKVKLCLV